MSPQRVLEVMVGEEVKARLVIEQDGLLRVTETTGLMPRGSYGMEWKEFKQMVQKKATRKYRRQVRLKSYSRQ